MQEDIIFHLSEAVGVKINDLEQKLGAHKRSYYPDVDTVNMFNRKIAALEKTQFILNILEEK